MLPYIFILVPLAIFSLLELFHINSKQQKLLLFVSFLLLWLFSGLRYNIGMDYPAYKELYENSLSKLNPDIKELGWAYFFYWFRNIGCPFELIILMISFFTIYCVFLFIQRYSPYPLLSILIFFCFTQYYTYTFNVMRQCLACYIFLASLKYIEERNMVKYMINIGFTVFFVHLTAIILLPLYFILHRSYPVWLKICVAFFCFFVAKFLILIIASSETYRIYLAFEQYAQEITITTYILIFISSLFLVIEGNLKKSKGTNILLNISFVAFLCLFVTCFFRGTPLVIVFLRFAYYFTPVLIVLLPLLVKKIFSIKSKRIVLFFIAASYIAIFCYTLSTGGKKNKLLPYKTILSK